MLSFFPTPYPDELWYSVLSRYHRRSGNANHATTRYELFGSGTKMPSVLYVNPGFYSLFDRLPDGLIDPKEVIDNHTLVPYVLRFAANSRIRQTYSCLINGSEVGKRALPALRQWVPSENQPLRYCPVCKQRDKEKYGEMYWHRSHQVELLPLCPTHRCRLIYSTVSSAKRTGEHFILPTEENCPGLEPQPPTQSWEEQLTDTLVCFLEAPLSGNIKHSHSKALFTIFQDRGSFSITSGKISPEPIREALLSYYGEKITAKYFPHKTLLPNLQRMVRTGTFSFPEQYALLSVMLGLPPDALLGNWVGLDAVAIKMRKMAQIGYLWSKKRVAEELGVQSSQLVSMARQRGITPFWLFEDSSNSLRQDDSSLPCLKTMVTSEMKSAIDRRVEDLGICNTAEYIRYLISMDLGKSS